MGSSKTDRALEAMRNRARKIIGSKHKDAQEALLASLLHNVDIKGCNSALTDLLTAGIASPRLMMTLLQCQPILFSLLADLNDSNSWRELASRFYRVQETIISLRETVPSTADDTTEAATDADSPEGSEQESTIKHPPVANDPDNAAHIEWLRNHTQLRLFNLYRGVVFNANCQLIHIDTDLDQISMELNNELGRVLTTDPNTKSTTLIANDNSSIGFPLELIDHKPGIAIFALHTPKTVYLDTRGNIDVHIQDLVHIDIHRGLYHFPEGTLIDFSATGIGLVAQKDDRMKIALNDTLGFRFQIGAAKVSTDGIIRGLKEHNNQLTLGVQLLTNRATQSLLQREVFRVQREIIITINEQGIPEDLLKDIR
ncbi:MAG: PilZ domain-containing protein [Mariprofundales bacterium]